MPAIEIPEVVREIIICADSDTPGERAAQAATQRFLRLGQRVRIARPECGRDFNDLLKA
jgi:DNA primase